MSEKKFVRALAVLAGMVVFARVLNGAFGNMFSHYRVHVDRIANSTTVVVN